jgi:hypothetical protein
VDDHAAEAAIRKAKCSLLPHCAGDTQTAPVSAIMITMPKLVGLKICLPRQRQINLLAMVTIAAAISSRGLLAKQ